MGNITPASTGRMRIKELVSAGHAAVSELPPAYALLMREMATRLDVTYVALTESIERQTCLAAEIEMMRDGERA